MTHKLFLPFSANRETVEDWENGQQLIKFLDQLDIFESCGKKAEIESLESLLNGQLRGNYLTKFYLPLSMDTHINSKRAQTQLISGPVSKLSQPTYQPTFDSSASPFSSQSYSQRDSGLESEILSQQYSHPLSQPKFTQIDYLQTYLNQSDHFNDFSQPYHSGSSPRWSGDPYSQGNFSQTGPYRL